MKYTVRPTGSMKELSETGVAKMFREDANGRRIEVGDYQNALLPKGAITHRIRFDRQKRRYNISIPDADLQWIVSELLFIDPETKKPIEKANPGNEYDPFFILETLSVSIPNSGLTMDSDEPLGKLWLYAFKSEPELFNIDNSTDNPLVKKQQIAKITTAEHSENEVSEEIMEGKRAQGILHSIKDDFQMMVEVCRSMDIIVGDNPDMEMMHTALYVKITTDKDFKSRDGKRNIEKFLEINDMPQEERSLRAKITEAIGIGIITKEGSNLVFNDAVIGNNTEKAYQFFSRDHNADMKGELLARIAERRNAGKIQKLQPAGEVEGEEGDAGFNF